MATRRIQEYLDGNHVHYVMISHSPAYTACEVAQSTHIPGKNLAKVVVVVMDGRLALAVVPSTHEVDMALLEQASGSLDARLADETEFAGRFEGCQVGTAPPFGNLFGLDTYVESSLAHRTSIAFNAGTHTDVVVMDFGDYRRLAKPILAHIDREPTMAGFHVAQL